MFLVGSCNFFSPLIFTTDAYWKCTFINIHSSFDRDKVNNMLPIINMLHLTTLQNVNHEHMLQPQHASQTTNINVLVSLSNNQITNCCSLLVCSIHTSYFKSVTIFTAIHKAIKTNWVQIWTGGSSCLLYPQHFVMLSPILK